MIETAVVGLGSNMGDREFFLQEAVSLLSHPNGIRMQALSSIYQTQPLDVPMPQGDYLNQVVVMHTELSAAGLLERCQSIEGHLGRPADHKAGLPRVIDLDIITYGATVCKREDLTLPHPRYYQRKFVLVPLAEVMPEFRDPVTGETISAMLTACPDRSRVWRYRSFQEQPC
jgi:2-amino-4-hydroxy-6-hydroxymethyldihydropteridine diphosphokinase